MALKITASCPRFMVKAGESIDSVAYEHWSEDLEKISFMYSGITELPITPPICPLLTTLLLSGIHLKEIPESFFTYMRCLEVLDLTFDYNIKSLPESISNLKNLHALILDSCDKLNYVPSLKKLKALKVFKLTESSVEEFPEGIEDLVNLIKLDLSYNIHLGLFLNCKLRRLSKIRFLRMDESTVVTVSAEDLLRLRDFKVVAVKFHNVHELNRYATSQHWQRVGKVLHLAFLPSYRVLFDGIAPPHNISFNLRKLFFYECRIMKNIFSVQFMQNFPNLERLFVRTCENVDDIIVEQEEINHQDDRNSISLPKLKTYNYGAYQD